MNKPTDQSICMYDDVTVGQIIRWLDMSIVEDMNNGNRDIAVSKAYLVNKIEEAWLSYKAEHSS